MLKSLNAEFLVFQRFLQLQSTVADRHQLTAGSLDPLCQSLVFALEFRHLLLVSAADDAPRFARIIIIKGNFI